ncbi:uncharacterized protein LOC144752157 [Lissotriton helveticus]
MAMKDDTQQAAVPLARNGYVKRNFKTKSEEKNIDSMKISDFDRCDSNGMTMEPSIEELAVKYEKKAKSTRIWGFVRRKRLNSGRAKRPQSMILTGEIIDPKPRMSFFERMRSIKRMRSSNFSKNSVEKHSEATVTGISIENKEEDRLSSIYRTRRSVETQRPFRHSYAGYIDDLDSSFEDVELNITASDFDPNDSRWLRDINVRLHGEAAAGNSSTLPSCRKQEFNFENSKSSTIAEGEIQRRCNKIQPELRRGKSTDVWSYLKGISRTSKDNSKLDEPSIDNVKSMDRIDNLSTSSSDLDKRGEQSQRSNNTTKTKNLGGVFRFFNNVAVAARKWRGSSRAPSNEEASSSIPVYQEQVRTSQHSSLLIENQKLQVVYSKITPLQSPDSGIQDNQTPRSSTPLQDVLKQSLHLDLFESSCPSDLTEDTGCSTDVPLSVEQPHPEPYSSGHQTESSTLLDTQGMCTAVYVVRDSCDEEDGPEKSSLGRTEAAITEDTNSLVAEKGSPEEQSSEGSEFNGSHNSSLSLSTTSSSNEEEKAPWPEDPENQPEVRSGPLCRSMHLALTHSQSSDVLLPVLKREVSLTDAVNALEEANGKLTGSHGPVCHSDWELHQKTLNSAKRRPYLEGNHLEDGQFPQVPMAVLCQDTTEILSTVTEGPRLTNSHLEPTGSKSSITLHPILKRVAKLADTVSIVPEADGEVTQARATNHVSDSQNQREPCQRSRSRERRRPLMETNCLENMHFAQNLLEEKVKTEEQTLSCCSEVQPSRWRGSYSGSTHSQLSNMQCPVLEEETMSDESADGSIDEELDASERLPSTSSEDTQSKYESNRKARSGDRLRTFSVADHLRDLQSHQTLPHPPHPLTRAPAFKIPLDRYHSLPLSQSTPTGLDQVGWMKRMLLSTGSLKAAENQGFHWTPELCQSINIKPKTGRRLQRALPSSPLKKRNQKSQKVNLDPYKPGARIRA